MHNWILVLPYLFGSLLYLATAICVGGALIKRERMERVSEKLLQLFLLYATGLGIISITALLLGLISSLEVIYFTPLIILLAIIGFIRIWQARLFHELKLLESIRAAYNKLAVLERSGAVLILLWGILLSVFLFIGGLRPDMGQDAFWYHLSVPMQWAIRGDVAVFPHVMPSSYWLGAESVYAVLLFYGDEILLNCAYGQALIAAVWLFPLLATWASNLRGGLLTAAIAFGAWTRTCGLAPYGPMNDAFGPLYLGLILWMLSRHVRTRTLIGAGTAGAAGFLSGTAATFKLVALGFWLPLVLLVFSEQLLIHRRNWKPVIRSAAFFAIGASFVILPWIIRNYVWTGNPLINIAPLFLDTNAEFQPLLAGYDNEPARLFPFNVEGFLQALNEGVPRKFYFAMTSMDSLFLMTVVAMISAFFGKGLFWKIQGLAILACYGGWFWLHGSTEVVRYFSMAYIMAAPAFGYLFGTISNHLSPKKWFLVLLLLSIVSFASFAKAQWRWMNFASMQWKPIPYLTQVKRAGHIALSENAYAYQHLINTRHATPPDAVILLPETPGSAYLWRRAYWAGYANKSPTSDWWNNLTPEQIHQDLLDRGITHIAWQYPASIDPRITRLIEMEKMHIVPGSAALVEINIP